MFSASVLLSSTLQVSSVRPQTEKVHIMVSIKRVFDFLTVTRATA